MNGDRPLSLSPTYRYKKDHDNFNHILANQMVKQVSSPTARAHDGFRNHQGATMTSDALMHPTPGGATPTSMLSHTGPNGVEFTRQPNATEMGMKQQSKPLLLKHTNNSCLLNQDNFVSPEIEQNSTLQAGPNISQSNPAYKMPAKLISSGAVGLQHPIGTEAGRPIGMGGPQPYMNQQFIKTQNMQTQFMNARQSNTNVGTIALNSEALPTISTKPSGEHHSNSFKQSKPMSQETGQSIPQIYENKSTTKSELRSEFSKQKITDQRSGLTNKSVINNKTFTIKNNNSRTSSQVVGQPNQVAQGTVEVNYGIQNRRTILGHQNSHNLQRQGESQLIKAGKLATTHQQLISGKDDAQYLVGASQAAKESGSYHPTPFAQHMQLNVQKQIENADLQYQQTINSSNKYLFNKTAANMHGDPKHIDNQLDNSEYNKMGPVNTNPEQESDPSMSDKINKFNNKIGQARNIENNSFYNQNSGQKHQKGSMGKVSQQSVFLNTTKTNLQSGVKSTNKGHYTTFNGSFEMHTSPNQHLVSGDLHNYNHQFQGNAKQVLNPQQLKNEVKNSDDHRINQQLQNHENQLKIKKFLNLVDLQDLVEKETQFRLNQAGEIANQQMQKQQDNSGSKSSGQKQEVINKMMQTKPNQIDLSQRHKIDPQLWKHFQNLLYFDHQNNALHQKLSLNQRKILINLRQQVLKNGFIGMNSEEITKTVKQFIEYFNLDDINGAQAKGGKSGEVKKENQQQFVNTFQQQVINDQIGQTQAMQYNRTEKNFSKPGAAISGNRSQQQNPGVFSQSQPKSGQVKSMSEVSPSMNNFQGGTGARVININKLNINIQQYANQPMQNNIHSGVQGVSYNGITNTGYNSRNTNIKQFPSGNGNQFNQGNGQPVPKQIQDTLFIMDCQLLGLLKHINLLNLDTAKQMPLSQEKDTKMSEAELVHFFMTRANSAITMMFKELPKLSEEAKQIINMIKAQQQVDLQDEISKIDTLIIEIDYVEYKNKLLQALFNNYGDTVLETIIHKIQQGPTEADTVKNLNSRHFQTINEYVDSIRNLHAHQQKLQGEPAVSNLGDDIFGTQRVDEFVPQIHGEELSDNLAYLYPNIYDPTIQSINFTPGYRGKRYKDKKINFGVMVKETKLYQALKCADQLAIKYNQENQGGLGQDKKCLSSFLVTHDCTLLRFMLFCSHAGIIRSAQASLRLFFKNVFIVIKPGSQVIQSTGKIFHHTTLPQVDVEKVTNYIQNQLKKKQQALENQAQLKRFNSLADGQDPSLGKEGGMNKVQACRGQSTNVTPSMNKPLKQGAVGNQTGMTIDRNKSTVSLNSYKSQKNLDANVKVDMSNHFNSMLSSIRADLLPEKPATIKIYHKPYTHLNQSRFQKTLKIYNEFVQLTFKNKLIYAQPGEGNSGDIQDFTQTQAARICKLGSQMGIKDLPKKHSLLRAPLLELFRNHRQLQKIKEQVLRYLFKILNEENEISQNFSSIVLAGNTFFLEKEQNKFKSIKDAKLGDEEILAITQQKTVSQIVQAQKNQAYKYQVGYGNNHFLIKSIMKNRRWWHQATTKDNVSNFDDAQIIWTQWCKNKLCNHLIQNQQFKFEFKLALEKIEKKCFFKGIEGNRKTNLNQSEVKVDKGRGFGQNVSPNKDFTHYKDARAQKLISSRQQKKNQVFISTQYKSIENQINSPDKVQEDDRAVQFTKSAKKKQSKKQKSVEDEDQSGSDDQESNADGTNSRNFGKEEGENGEIKVPKMFRQVKAMKEKFQRVYNRLEFNQHLNNKKALFINMRNFYNYCCEGDVFNTLPLTFHIKDGVNDPNFKEFTKYYNEQKAICAKDPERKNVWVIKPGENSNRGNGIKVESEFNKITQQVESSCSKYGNDGKRTVILQKYIDNPNLYNKRKWDIRCFALVTCHNGIMKAYFYRDGYIRTASKEFTLQNLQNKYIHLVNDAIQQHSDEYGKFETANKLSYQDFQKYLNSNFPDLNINMERDIIMQIRKIVTDSIRATFHLIDSKQRLNSYELFGYDFMFDADFKPYLIEVNSNPCLEFSSSLLAKIFTSMLDNTLRIAVDPLFPPSQEGFASKKSAEGIDLCPENRFDLIFDERIDGPGLLEKLNKIKLEDINEVKALDELEESEGEEPQEEQQSEREMQRINSNESINEQTPAEKNETEKEDEE